MGFGCEYKLKKQIDGSKPTSTYRVSRIISVTTGLS
jgi:hypothetical protein